MHKDREILTQKIRSDFDRLASLETEGWNHNNHYHNFLLRQLPSQSENVLDLGCGTGEFARLLAKRADHVMAIDLSPNSIAIAKQRSQQYPNIDFQVADILQWEFPVKKFDAIASIATLHHLSLADLLPRLRTSLKPGGKLIILDLLKNDHWQDLGSDAIAVPLNWLFQIVKNKNLKPSPQAIKAMREHQLTDEYLTRSQAQRFYPSLLPGARVRKHLFWRYSVVWEQPLAKL
jgi:SAM-dependent methyltransferase